MQMVLTALIIIFAVLFNYYFPIVGKRMIEGYMIGPLPVTVVESDKVTVQISLNPGEQTRLLSQLQELRGRAKHHFQTMIFIYSVYYMVISLTLLSGVIAAVCLFLITRVGWPNSSLTVRNLFLSFTAVAAITSAYPAAFSHQDNIAQNKSRYLQYSALIREVQTYLATGRHQRGSVSDAGGFVLHVDSEI